MSIYFLVLDCEEFEGALGIPPIRFLRDSSEAACDDVNYCCFPLWFYVGYFPAPLIEEYNWIMSARSSSCSLPVFIILDPWDWEEVSNYYCYYYYIDDAVLVFFFWVAIEDSEDDVGNKDC